jgi:hypothetical protein
LKHQSKTPGFPTRRFFCRRFVPGGSTRPNSSYLLVQEHCSFEIGNPDGSAVCALEKIVGVTIRVHVDFDPVTGGANWAFHGFFPFLLPFVLNIDKQEK